MESFLMLYFICFKLVKKSYYRLALIYHPDKMSDSDEFSADKFNVIHQAYSILSNPELRLQYDAEGSKVIFAKATNASEWESYLKTSTQDDVNNAAEMYKGSTDEKSDVLKEFITGKGSMIHMLNTIPFMRVEDGSRIISIIQAAMLSGETPRMGIKKLPKNYK